MQNLGGKQSVLWAIGKQSIVNHIGGGGRCRFDTVVNVIHQQNGWRSFIMWWFSRLNFCTSRLKIRQKKTQMEKESSKEWSVSFSWTNESLRECYANCFLGLTYGFWNKNFQLINLFICHCSFITLAKKMIERLQIVRFLETLQTGYSPF